MAVRNSHEELNMSQELVFRVSRGILSLAAGMIREYFSWVRQ
jgi:hypothetical protein